jgi:hypothetical protein
MKESNGCRRLSGSLTGADKAEAVELAANHDRQPFAATQRFIEPYSQAGQLWRQAT